MTAIYAFSKPFHSNRLKNGFDILPQIVFPMPLLGNENRICQTTEDSDARQLWPHGHLDARFPSPWHRGQEHLIKRFSKKPAIASQSRVSCFSGTRDQLEIRFYCPNRLENYKPLKTRKIEAIKSIKN
jgi:hypothetical protein